MECGVAAIYSGPQGTPWAPNPSTVRGSREALELPEPLAISVEQPEVTPEETKTAPYKARFKRVNLRQDDFDKFGYSAGCKACAFIRQGLDQQGIPHDEDCRTRIVQRLQETVYGRKRIKIARRKNISRANQKRSRGLKRRRFDFQSVLVDLA